jgi:tRNA threonylcarbamoyladenosine biosynthesis protein TsaB
VILGIETATAICGIGIVDGEKIVAEIRFNIKNIHAEALSESIEQLLRLSGIDFKNISAFAVSIGPGSFTGLRIGLATAKGLAFASGKPLAAVSTLQAQAAACSVASSPLPVVSVVPVIKARQREVYTACFRNAWPEPIAISDEILLPVDEFSKWLQTPAMLCGNGVPMLRERGALENFSGITIIPEPAAMLSGGLVARLGATKLAAGAVADLAALEPRYLQEFKLGPEKS